MWGRNNRNTTNVPTTPSRAPLGRREETPAQTPATGQPPARPQRLNNQQGQNALGRPGQRPPTGRADASPADQTAAPQLNRRAAFAASASPSTALGLPRIDQATGAAVYREPVFNAAVTRVRQGHTTAAAGGTSSGQRAQEPAVPARDPRASAARPQTRPLQPDPAYIQARTQQLQIGEVAKYSAFAQEEIKAEIRRGGGAVDRLVGQRLNGVVDELASKINGLQLDAQSSRQYSNDVNDLRSTLAQARAASDEPDIAADSASHASASTHASAARSSAESSTPTEKFFELTKDYAKVVDQELLPHLGAHLSAEKRSELGAELEALGTAIGQLAQDTQLTESHREHLTQILNDEIPGYKALLGIDAPPSEPVRAAREERADSSLAPLNSAAARRPGLVSEPSAFFVTGAVRENAANVRQDFNVFEHNLKAFVSAFDVRLDGGIDDLYKLGQASEDLLKSASSLQGDVNATFPAGDEKASKTATIELARATISIKQQELAAALSNLID